MKKKNIIIYACMHACMHTFFDDDTLKGVFLEFFILFIQEIEEEVVHVNYAL